MPTAGGRCPTWLSAGGIHAMPKAGQGRSIVWEQCMRCSAVQCSAARRRLFSFSHTHAHTQTTRRKRGWEPSQRPGNAGRRRTCCWYMDRGGRAGSLGGLGQEQSCCGAAGSPMSARVKTEADFGGPTALVAAPRGSCQPQAGTAWGSAGPRRAGGRGIQDRNWTMRQMKRDGRGHGR